MTKDIKRDDMVDHPSHYNQGRIEVIDAIEDWGLGFHLGSAIKYIARSKHKGNEKEALQKAMWYIQRFIDECIDSNKVTINYFMGDELYYSEEIESDNSYEEVNKLDEEGEIRTILSEEDIGLLYRGINGFFRATSKDGESKRSSKWKPYFDVIDRLLSEYQWRGRDEYIKR